jgi:hypothetical protein
MFDPGLGELVAEGLRSRSFSRPDAQEEQLYSVVERSVIGEHAAVGRLRIESAATAAA